MPDQPPKHVPAWIKALLLIGVAVVLIGLASYRWLYPYGHRVGCMPLTMGALVYYAHEHQGSYPTNGRTPLQALQTFYPNYLGAELAGITGDREEVLRRLANGQPIDEFVSSWIYNPGFRLEDDPRIALIWERQEGVTVNGHRADGHAVGFVDGSFRQVSSRDWAGFLTEQKRLRAELFAKRKLENKGVGIPPNN